jgi:hypothetical protein
MNHAGELYSLTQDVERLYIEEKALYRRMVMLRVVELWLVAGLAFTQLSCNVKHQVPLLDDLAGKEYFTELKEWYRKQRVYSDFDVRFYVEVTMMSEALNDAYVAEYARLYSLDLEAQRAMLDERRAQLRENDQFFISLYTPGEDWDKLKVADDVWKLRVHYQPGGVEHAPVRVESASAQDAKVQYFFPYTENWARHYWVYVPRPNDSQSLRLVMEGVVGRQVFDWKRTP